MAFSTARTLPLFPLDVVLFPGMVLPLHIFEERYRKMVRDCMAEDGSFGMVWADEEPLELHPGQRLIGTRATISQLEPLEDGRFNLNAIGGERFVVRALSYEEPYLVGEVEPLSVGLRDEARAGALLAPLTHLFARYLGLLSVIAGQRVALSEMPRDPATLAFVVAVLYQAQNPVKQELLSIPLIEDLMQREIELLRLEIPLIEQGLTLQAEQRLPEMVGGMLASFGLN